MNDWSGECDVESGEAWEALAEVSRRAGAGLIGGVLASGKDNGYRGAFEHSADDSYAVTVNEGGVHFRLGDVRYELTHDAAAAVLALLEVPGLAGDAGG